MFRWGHPSVSKLTFSSGSGLRVFSVTVTTSHVGFWIFHKVQRTHNKQILFKTNQSRRDQSVHHFVWITFRSYITHNATRPGDTRPVHLLLDAQIVLVSNVSAGWTVALAERRLVVRLVFPSKSEFIERHVALSPRGRGFKPSGGVALSPRGRGIKPSGAWRRPAGETGSWRNSGSRWTGCGCAAAGSHTPGRPAAPRPASPWRHL